MACLSKVQAAMETMRPSERKLARLIIDEPHLVLGASAKEIGVSGGVSAASVVRFAQMLGFASLREMRADLQRDVLQQMNVEQNISMDFKAPLMSIAPNINSRIATGMQTALDMQSYEMLEKAAHTLYGAPNVYLYGIGASSLPALDLQQKLVRVNKRAIYREDQDLGILDAYYMTHKDVMVAFSYSGTNERVNKAVRVATQRGMNCIAVTRFGRSPLISMATLTLPLPENEAEIRHAAVQSKYAALLVVDLLFVSYVQCMDGDIAEVFEKTRSVIRAE